MRTTACFFATGLLLACGPGRAPSVTDAGSGGGRASTSIPDGGDRPRDAGQPPPSGDGGPPLEQVTLTQLHRVVCAAYAACGFHEPMDLEPCVRLLEESSRIEFARLDAGYSRFDGIVARRYLEGIEAAAPGCLATVPMLTSQGLLFLEGQVQAGGECLDSQDCVAGLRCDQTCGSRCRPRIPTDPCLSDSECGAGSICDDGSRCGPLPVPSATQSCSDTFECEAGMACIGGQCASPRRDGESCANHDDCSSRICDEVTRACTRARSVPIGSACTRRGQCDSFGLLVCRGAWVNPDGGVGLAGVCDLPRDGDSCRGHGDCGVARWCNAGVCEAAGAQTPCRHGLNCRRSDFCEAGRCRPRLAIGEACSRAGLPCVEGSFCVGASGSSQGTCEQPRRLGDACSAQKFCAGLTVDCLGGTCAVVGLAGTPCRQTWTMPPSECLENVCESGFCTPVTRADGADCRFDRDCVSGVCDRKFKCSSACR